jgi:hypothetical protein
MAPHPPSAVVPRTGPPVATSRLPSPPPPARAILPTFRPPTPPIPSPRSRARLNACQLAAEALRHVPSPVPDSLPTLPTQPDEE